MDKLDLRISQTLGTDGRMSNSEIARRLNVSEGTVRQRLKKLTDSGQLRVQAMVNSELIPSRYLAIIGLKIEGRQLQRCAEGISKLPEVQRTLFVTGRYDMIVSLLLDSHTDMVEFVMQKLSTVPGIVQSETFVCLKNSDPWFPADSLWRLQGDTTGR